MFNPGRSSIQVLAWYSRLMMFWVEAFGFHLSLAMFYFTLILFGCWSLSFRGDGGQRDHM